MMPILSWVPILTAVSMIPSQQQLDSKLSEYVWFDNSIAVWMGNKDEPYEAASTVPYILSAALETLTNKSRPRYKENNKKKVLKSRIRL